MLKGKISDNTAVECSLLLFLLSAVLVSEASRWNPAARQSPRPADKQVVLETSLGSIVIELYPGLAPRHVEKFLHRIRDGFYVGTTFHRAVARGIIQGGDPLSRDPSQRRRYGTGGLFELKQEFNSLSHTAGTVSAVRVPNQPDSAGSQFFICVSDQKQLDGQYTAFGRVVEGMDVVEKISLLPTDEKQMIEQRVEILRTTLRDPPLPPAIPFVDSSPAELKNVHAVISTSFGEIELRFFPEEAPQHVRQFLRFAKLGLYDGTTFGRIVPHFVIQGGSILERSKPVPKEYQPLLKNLPSEVNDHKHVRGALAMAQADEPDSGMDSFFIVLEPQPHLDGIYTVFGEVVRGMDVVDRIAGVPAQGEAPVSPIPITIRVIEPPVR